MQPVVQAGSLVELQHAVQEVVISDAVRRYIVALMRATRDHELVELGVSPRGTLALSHSAQALAAVSGRSFVLPDDVKALAPAVLGHRMILNAEAWLHSGDPLAAVANVVASVPMPVEV